MKSLLVSMALLLASTATAREASVDLRGEAAPAAAGKPYAARNLPDRIILNPGADPAREMAISWRTDGAQATAEAELAALLPSPGFGANARKLAGESTPAVSENGAAVHHRLRFTDLQPDTAYAYRVKGAAGWSEWHQFRTAAAEARPFRFLYFGDTQNSIREFGSLAWRRALLQAGNPALMVHAGDLVGSRDDLVHDDEWGEWTANGGWALATIPQLVAAGNHEYVDVELPHGEESRKLAPHWPLTFALPANGAPGTEPTTYATQWQGVRFVVLDGTSALDLGTRDAQTRWLDAQLAAPGAQWKVVVMHQPIYTCARPQDTEKLKEAWQPLFEKHGVDLVLQGHDHCYSRLTADAGRDAGAKARAAGGHQGPVYMVSVAGSKMYGLNDRSATQPDRVAEDSSLFQIVDVDGSTLRLRAYLNTGMLYDGFDLLKGQDGRNRLTAVAETMAARRCTGPAQLPDADMPSDRLGPDGLLCNAYVKD